uniref:Rho RNA-BD domain-containing protein n=1 Tax=Chromera velia CCMP2878 TaxID=1169474 RepID=A0A0G4GUX2_9ALVE|eukprot:Cvel_23484.t1-p1 / transcript=Cvel_23484.t1 / gene=Cvel_23484 / organism=Chromera_velia_CCMP2878 / gene_product=hypothetical protein / transcript_product=hypothetical protein / location=Cvel_scaffold2425:14760-19925(+) / protein_length=890 / sequence_SO=supercontig / SO=protein_coding / is_pseudo=false
MESSAETGVNPTNHLVHITQITGAPASPSPSSQQEFSGAKAAVPNVSGGSTLPPGLREEMEREEAEEKSQEGQSEAVPMDGDAGEGPNAVNGTEEGGEQEGGYNTNDAERQERASEEAGEEDDDRMRDVGERDPRDQDQGVEGEVGMLSGPSSPGRHQESARWTPGHSGYPDEERDAYDRYDAGGEHSFSGGREEDEIDEEEEEIEDHEGEPEGEGVAVKREGEEGKEPGEEEGEVGDGKKDGEEKDGQAGKMKKAFSHLEYLRYRAEIATPVTVADLLLKDGPGLKEEATKFGVSEQEGEGETARTKEKEELIEEIVLAAYRGVGLTAALGQLELRGDRGTLRVKPGRAFSIGDVYIAGSQIRKFILQAGDKVLAEVRAPYARGERLFCVAQILAINGKPTEVYESEERPERLKAREEEREKEHESRTEHIVREKKDTAKREAVGLGLPPDAVPGMPFRSRTYITGIPPRFREKEGAGGINNAVSLPPPKVLRAGMGPNSSIPPEDDRDRRGGGAVTAGGVTLRPRDSVLADRGDRRGSGGGGAFPVPAEASWRDRDRDRNRERYLDGGDSSPAPLEREYSGGHAHSMAPPLLGRDMVDGVPPGGSGMPMSMGGAAVGGGGSSFNGRRWRDPALDREPQRGDYPDASRGLPREREKERDRGGEGRNSRERDPMGSAYAMHQERERERERDRDRDLEPDRADRNRRSRPTERGEYGEYGARERERTRDREREMDAARMSTRRGTGGPGRSPALPVQMMDRDRERGSSRERGRGAELHSHPSHQMHSAHHLSRDSHHMGSMQASPRVLNRDPRRERSPPVSPSRLHHYSAGGHGHGEEDLPRYDPDADERERLRFAHRMPTQVPMMSAPYDRDRDRERDRENEYLMRRHQY